MTPLLGPLTVSESYFVWCRLCFACLFNSRGRSLHRHPPTLSVQNLNIRPSPSVPSTASPFRLLRSAPPASPASHTPLCPVRQFLLLRGRSGARDRAKPVHLLGGSLRAVLLVEEGTALSVDALCSVLLSQTPPSVRLSICVCCAWGLAAAAFDSGLSWGRCAGVAVYALLWPRFRPCSIFCLVLFCFGSERDAGRARCFSPANGRLWCVDGGGDDGGDGGGGGGCSDGGCDDIVSVGWWLSLGFGGVANVGSPVFALVTRPVDGQSVKNAAIALGLCSCYLF